MNPSTDMRIKIIAVDERLPEAVLMMNLDEEHLIYVPERTATIVKVPRRSHVALGHYECGGCGTTIDAGDCYCRRCGVRLEGASE